MICMVTNNAVALPPSSITVVRCRTYHRSTRFLKASVIITTIKRSETTMTGPAHAFAIVQGEQRMVESRRK
jgi:hypothetical protein